MAPITLEKARGMKAGLMGSVLQSPAMTGRRIVVGGAGGAGRAAGAVPVRAAQSSAADADAARIFQEAAQRGHREGFEKGYESGMERAAADAQAHLQCEIASAIAQATEKLNAHAGRLEALADSFARQAGDLATLAEDEMVALAFEAVCRVLGTHAASRDGVRAQLLHAIEAWESSEPVTLCLHPDDAALLDSDSELATRLRGALPRLLKWQADPQVELGGCMLKSAQGALDARLETQIEALRDSILRAHEEPQA